MKKLLVQKEINMCGCVFCHNEKIRTDFVYGDKLVMAFMDMDPINEGHILLIPKQHYLDVDEIPNDFPRYVGDRFGWTYGSEEKNVNFEIAERIRKQLESVL